MFKILLKFSQELKSTDISLFKNTNAPPVFRKIRKLDMNFVDFQRDHMILWKMKNLRWNREEVSQSRNSLFTPEQQVLFLSLFIWLFLFLLI